MTSWPKTKTIQVVTDTRGWFDIHASRLVENLLNLGHDARLVWDYSDIVEGDIAFFLSCTKIAPPQVVCKSPWSVVVHASALPKGRGFSPIVWQVLAGVNDVPVSMIRMTEQVDAGDIIMQRMLKLSGFELNQQLRSALGDMIVEMCVEFSELKNEPVTVPQVGEPSWYARRFPQDSRIDPKQSLEEQFNLLRVVDNDAYPAFFDHLGHRYFIKISLESDDELNKKLNPRSPK